MYDLRRMGGDDHLYAPDPAYVEKIACKNLLPDHMEGNLRLIEDHERSRRGVEQKHVEHDQYLLLSGGELLQL